MISVIFDDKLMSMFTTLHYTERLKNKLEAPISHYMYFNQFQLLGPGFSK